MPDRRTRKPAPSPAPSPRGTGPGGAAPSKLRDPSLPEGWPAGLKPWRDVVMLRDEIKRGTFEESEFAASLYDVVLGKASARYQHPVRFFQGTAFTRGLSDLLRRTLRRLAGEGGDGVIQLQTPFGGGKTHTLLALYHLAANWAQVQEVDTIRDLTREVGVTNLPPVRVAAFAGQEVNALKIRADTPAGGEIYNLWGEIAYQLATCRGHANIWPRVRPLIEQNDQRGVNPGKQVLREVLDLCGPSLILLDELVAYANALDGIRGREKIGPAKIDDFYDFLQALTEAASQSGSVLVVATLVDSKDAGGEAAVRRLEKIRARFQRVEQKLEPIEGDEIFDVVRRALFEDTGPLTVHEEIVRHYHDEYLHAHSDYPSRASTAEYRERMLRAYPFHPELILTLRNRWGGLPNFQRTRGVLRLLGMLLSACYQARPAALIQPSHVALEGEVRAELVGYLGSGFQGVVDADLAESGHAAQIDASDEAFRRYELAQGLARAIFLSSPDVENQRGAAIDELHLAVWEPSMNRHMVGTARDRLTDRLYYLHEDANTYYFDTQANLNRIVVEREAAIREADIFETIRAALPQALGAWRGAGGAIPDPSRRGVPDRPELTLVVLDPSDPGADESRGEELVRGLWEKRGEAPRTHRNALIFLGTAAEEGQRLQAHVRSLLALESVQQSAGRSVTLSEADRAALQQRARAARGGLVSRVSGAYSVIFAPALGGGLQRMELAGTLLQQGALADAVWNALAERQRIARELAPSRLLSLGVDIAGTRNLLWPENDLALNAERLAGYFSQLTWLPILPSRRVLQETIAKGVKDGEFGVGYGDGKQFSRVIFKKPLTPDDVPLASDVWIIRPEEAQRLAPPPSEPSTVAADGAVLGGTGVVPPPAAGVPARRFRLSGAIEWERWDSQIRDLHRYIVSRATAAGAKVTLRFQVDVEKPDGLDPKLVSDLRESLQSFRDTSAEPRD